MPTFVTPLDWLREYLPRACPEEIEGIRELSAALDRREDCLSRNRLSGHIAASAWVVSPDRQLVLLTHHKKLGCWIYLGGHADGDPDLAAAALRELWEETGLRRIHLLDKRLFDFDRHLIPAYKTVPAHWHYDFRFLIEADPAEPLVVSDESHGLRWVPICVVAEINPNFGIPRMGSKTPYVPCSNRRSLQP